MEKHKEYDRRTKPRYRTTGETFAYIRNHFSMVGRIRDAGLGGLAVECASSHDRGIEGDIEVDILVNRNGFSLLRMPGRVAWKEDLLGSRPGGTRRLGIEFNRLTRKQTSRLKYFLMHHTEAG